MSSYASAGLNGCGRRNAQGGGGGQKNSAEKRVV